MSRSPLTTMADFEEEIEAEAAARAANADTVIKESIKKSEAEQARDDERGLYDDAPDDEEEEDEE